jgi:hypothetical protein
MAIHCTEMVLLPVGCFLPWVDKPRIRAYFIFTYALKM